MSKIFGFIFLLAAVVLVSSGVVEISVHPQRLSAIPGVNGKFDFNVPSGNITGKLSTIGISAKRYIELFLAESPDKKAELALGYVEADIQRLQDHFDSKAEPETIITDGALLVTSLEKAQQYTKNASPEKLAQSQQRSQQMMTDANSALAQIQALEKQFQEHQQQLSNVATALGTFVKNSKEGEVAGTQDEAPQDKKPESSKIPLNF